MVACFSSNFGHRAAACATLMDMCPNKGLSTKPLSIGAKVLVMSDRVGSCTARASTHSFSSAVTTFPMMMVAGDWIPTARTCLTTSDKVARTTLWSPRDARSTTATGSDDGKPRSLQVAIIFSRLPRPIRITIVRLVWNGGKSGALWSRECPVRTRS